MASGKRYFIVTMSPEGSTPATQLCIMYAQLRCDCEWHS